MPAPKTQPDYGMVAVFNLSALTLADQQSAGLQLDVNGNLKVVSAGASGGAGAGTFNTTQPTYTNGQAAQAQYTSRGAAIVATGVDPFTVAPMQGAAQFETAVSVATSSGALIGARAARRFLAIFNDGANPVYVSTTGTAALSAGFRLPAGGQLIFDSYVPTGALTAIAATGATAVTVVEGT